MKPFDILDYMICIGVGIYFISFTIGMGVKAYRDITKKEP